MTVCPFTRYALVRGARSRREAEAYLPDNYRVVHETTDPDPLARRTASVASAPMFVIEGRDSHGWTLDGYVAPRYASGLIWVEEIDLSHPLMKEVPSDA